VSPWWAVAAIGGGILLGGSIVFLWLAWYLKDVWR